MNLEENLLSHMVTLYLKCWATPKLSSKAVCPFCLPLWSECLVFLKIHMLKANPHSDGFRTGSHGIMVALCYKCN